MSLLPENFNQKGFAPIVLVVLLLFGIAAGTFLVQRRTNLIPKAAEDPYAQLKAEIAKLPDNSGVYIALPGDQTITKNSTQQFPSFSVIKLWIAAYIFDQKLYDTYKSDVDKMLINSDNNAANSLIDKLGGLENINTYIASAGYSSTRLKRKMLVTPTSSNDNLTSAEDSYKFLKRILEGSLVNSNASNQLYSILGRRTSGRADPFIPTPPQVLNSGFIGKSGILNDGRNDVGTFLDKNGNIVYFAILVPTGGDSSATKITNIEQALYNGGQVASSVFSTICLNNKIYSSADAISEAIEDCGPNKTCVVTNNKAKCKVQGTAPAEVQAENCSPTDAQKCPSNSIGCYKIDNRPRCVFSSQASLSCTQAETDFCKNPPDPREGCEVSHAVIVKGQTKTSVKYTKCTAAKSGAAAPAAAPAAGGPAAATVPDACKSKVGCTYSEGENKCFRGVCSGADCKFNTSCSYQAAADAGCLGAAYTVDGVSAKAGEPVACPGAGQSGVGAGDSTTGSKISDPNASCGQDTKGLDIPCYKIGVFDEATLQATIADAKIASANYALYRKIIEDLQKFVDTSQAAAKTAAAQRQADACINNTSI